MYVHTGARVHYYYKSILYMYGFIDTTLINI